MLTAIEIDPVKVRTTFKFDQGGSLVTRSYDDELHEHWMLYCPNGKVFCFRSDGKCSYQAGNTPPELKEFGPFKNGSRNS